MSKGKKADDSVQALALLQLVREYAVDVAASAILRAEVLKADFGGPAGALQELDIDIRKSEQAIIAAAKEHFADE